MNPGDILDGRYEITARLGAGGMGEVYKATHTLLGAPRVIKVVHAQIASNTDARDRFLREARIATKIQHPNVATLHDFAALPDGSHYMVWEYIEGENLAQRLRAGGTLTPRTAVRIAVEALQGLEAIHRAGIIHRDISPENLMITRDGRVKIIDLGVAKMDDPDTVSQTRTGIFVGKLRYSSPEQLGFLPDGEKVDGRTDIYAMAMVVIELLTGRPPYEAKSPHEYFLHHAREIEQPTIELPAPFPGSEQLESVLARALSRDRNRRYPTAREFAEALERVESILPAGRDGAVMDVPAGDEHPTVALGTGPQTVVRTAAGPRTEQIAVAGARSTLAETVRTTAPAAAPARGRLAATAAALALLLAVAGGAYALWPKVSHLIIREEARSESAAPARPATASLLVTPPAGTATAETATAPAAVVEEQPLAPATPVERAAVTEPEERAPIPARVENEPRERLRRVAVYRDGPGRNPANDRALDDLREELRGVSEVALRAGGDQVAVYRAIHRVLPDLTFTGESDVVITFNTTRERLGREQRHLAATATIEKNGRLIFRYELSSWVDPSAAADSFAQTIADAFE